MKDKNQCYTSRFAREHTNNSISQKEIINDEKKELITEPEFSYTLNPLSLK